MTTAAAFRPLSKEDIADVLGVSIRTIENWIDVLRLEHAIEVEV